MMLIVEPLVFFPALTCLMYKKLALAMQAVRDENLFCVCCLWFATDASCVLEFDKKLVDGLILMY